MKKRELTERQQKTTAIIALSVAIVTMVLIAVFIGIPLVRFISVPERFREWVEAHGAWGYVAFVGMEVLKVLCVFIPGEPLELAAGYAFGVWKGMLLCIIGISIGSILVFLLVKKFGRSIVGAFFKPERLESLQHIFTSRKNIAIFIFIYIIPGTPKDFLNYCAGLTEMSCLTWIFVCSIGRIPSVITSTVAGNAFEQKNYLFGFLVFAFTLAIGLIGLFIYNKITKKKEDQSVK